jgi:hypothetical protein
MSKSLKTTTALQYTRAASLLIPPKFQTASRLTFDIEKLDSILKLGIGECICIV